jgi:hypothetical protein
MRADSVFRRMVLSAILVFPFTSDSSRADDVADSIKLLQSVEPGGKGTGLLGRPSNLWLRPVRCCQY